MENYLNTMKNDELVRSTKLLVQEERRIQVKFLLHLKEIESRRLFLDLGYSSLFDFVTKELGYSESSGYRRIQAMRLMKSVPEIEQKINNGSFSLTAAAQVQTFIKQEEKQNGRISKAAAEELIIMVENKSSRQIEKHLLSLKPAHSITSEKIRQLTETHTEIKLVVPEELKQKLDQLKLLLSHVNPEMSYQDLFSYLADKAIVQLNPEYKKGAVKKKLAKNQNANNESLPTPEVENEKRTRYISAHVRATIWKRANGCCSFVSPVTGKSCGSKFQLQLDHIHPFALGGKTKVENLRLLCAQHNRWQARKVFKTKFEEYQKR